MSDFLGDFATSKVVRIRFNTISLTTSAPATLTPGSAPTVVIRKDGAVVTPSGGVTLVVDADGVTGFNTLTIDMGVDTATFTAGSEYMARLGAGALVGSTSAAGIIVGEWSVANRNIAANVTQWLGGTPNALVSGRVDASAGAVADKSGYALTQTFPTNFGTLAIDTNGAVTTTGGGGSGGDVNVGTGTVVSAVNSPSTTQIDMTSTNLDTKSGAYTDRILYFDTSSESKFFATTKPCVHTYANGVHTFRFAEPNNNAPAVDDVGKVMGPVTISQS